MGGEVDAASSALEGAKKTSEDAATAAADAAAADVDFSPCSLSSLHDDGAGKTCGPWLSDPSYTSAKAAAAAAASAASDAAAAVPGFETALEATEAAAAKAVAECECKTYTDYTAAWTAATAHSDMNE